MRRSFEELSCGDTADGHAVVRAAIKFRGRGRFGLALNRKPRGPAERIHIDCDLDNSAKGDFKLLAEVPGNAKGERQ